MAYDVGRLDFSQFSEGVNEGLKNLVGLLREKKQEGETSNALKTMLTPGASTDDILRNLSALAGGGASANTLMQILPVAAPVIAQSKYKEEQAQEASKFGFERAKHADLVRLKEQELKIAQQKADDFNKLWGQGGGKAQTAMEKKIQRLAEPATAHYRNLLAGLRQQFGDAPQLPGIALARTQKAYELQGITTPEQQKLLTDAISAILGKPTSMTSLPGETPFTDMQGQGAGSPQDLSIYFNNQ